MMQTLFSTNETDQAIRDATRRFLTDCCGFEQRRAGKALDDVSAWSKMAELGWFSLAAPETHGGLQASTVQLLHVLEEAGRVLATTPLVANLLVAPPVLARSSLDFVERYMQGQVRLAYVHSNVRGEELRWTQQRRKLTLTGRSAPSIGADVATHLIISARHPDSGLAGVFCVPAGHPSVGSSTLRLIDGSTAAVLNFTGQAWDAAEVTIDVSESAEALCDELMDRACAGVVAEAFGAADAGFHVTLAYLKQRVQFGKPLSALQAVQHMMADAFCSLEQQRSLLLALSGALDGPAPARRFAVSAAKAFLGGRSRQAIETCIQLSGGIGVTDEYVLGHYYKRVLVASALYGDMDVHLRRIATEAVSPLASV